MWKVNGIWRVLEAELKIGNLSRMVTVNFFNVWFLLITGVKKSSKMINSVQINNKPVNFQKHDYSIFKCEENERRFHHISPKTNIKTHTKEWTVLFLHVSLIFVFSLFFVVIRLLQFGKLYQDNNWISSFEANK